jgi:nuclear pore complex protein Nup155
MTRLKEIDFLTYAFSRKTHHLLATIVDVFNEKVEYLLVIATPIEIHLLGLAVGSGSSQHTFYITNMSVPTDNVAIRSILGTADGRIFMNGNDGRLWEIDYQAEEGWFSKKCSKREVVASPLSYFVPTFLSRIRVDPIVKVVFDESRQIVYGLTENSNIEVGVASWSRQRWVNV